MFSIAEEITIFTRKNGEEHAFLMNTKDIEQAIKGSSKKYRPQQIQFQPELILKETGTTVILKSLKKSINLKTADYFKTRIARRFSVIGSKYCFQVFINEDEVTIRDRNYFSKLEYIWLIGNETFDGTTLSIKQFPLDSSINNETSLIGWIGSVKNAGALSEPISDGSKENLNKISLVVRGKVAMENILELFPEGGLYTKYLIGEIQADFLDNDDEQDIATTDRQDFNQEDPRFKSLVSIIHSWLKQISRQWNEERKKDAVTDLSHCFSPHITNWLNSLQGDSKDYAEELLGRVNTIVVDGDQKKEILKYSILAFEKLKYQNELSKISTINIENIDVLSLIFTSLDEFEATLYAQIIQERLRVIRKLEDAIDNNVLEKAVQDHLFDNLWLLDPTWSFIDKSAYKEKSLEKALDDVFQSFSEEEKKGRIDIGFQSVAQKEIIIELKRPGRKLTEGELLNQITKYNSAIQKALVQLERSNAFEIIIVIDKQNWEIDQLNRFNESLKSYQSRIVFYDKLLSDAKRTYEEYERNHSQAIEFLEPLISDLT